MTSNLPSGTVTFLFTDIEGSTKLSQEYPDEMRALVARHNEILENAIRAQDGYIFNIVGDSYHAAFQEAEQALHAALEAQRHLCQEAWSPAPIKVRMGIHTGAANLEDENSASPYSGYATLSLTSRVMSAGHGGQILLSQGSVDQLEGKLAHIELKDMGEHHLKDILRPQQIHQVVVQDLPTDFPPLAAQKSINHNLPLNLTSFIGREREISEIKTKLGESRLFTLTGPGGTGKTRLSIQVGGEILAEQPDGVWIVELAPLADPALIPQTVAAVFGLRESPDRALIEQINDYLRAKRLLLILDNCEHLVDACARLAESLLQACPNIKIFASSREALGVRGETTYRVPSLYLPDPGQVTAEAVLRCESVQLFVDRASAVNPDFQVTDTNAAFVAQICRRLDGIPLALELAAARARVLSVEQIAVRLDDRFRLLTGGSRTALPRQQTLRALIDWSYDLLTEKEKVLFRRLAVFTGGWTLEAAEEVCSEDGLDKYEMLDLMTQLVDKSLTITEEKNGQVRYHRLETIRQYAREKLLETDEAITVRDRHLEYFISLVKWADENWFGPLQDQVQQTMVLESDNFRSALAWATESKPEKAMKMISWIFALVVWVMRGQLTEGRDWCRQIIESTEALYPNDEDAPVDHLNSKGRVYMPLALILMNLGDHQASQAASEKGVELARLTGDQRLLAEGLATLSLGTVYSGNPGLALQQATESIEISETMGYRMQLTWGYRALGNIHSFMGNEEQAERYTNEYRRLFKDAGALGSPADEETILGERAFRAGDIKDALLHLENAITILSEHNDKLGLVNLQSEAAHQLRTHGFLDDALALYRQSIRIWQDFGHRAAVAHQLECFGFIALAREDPGTATQLCSAADAIRTSIQSVRSPVEQNEFEDAKSKLQAGLEASEFDTGWQAGQTMPLEQAVDFALAEVR
jgi:predicted ATPase/class 3 adenylate cyclase